MEIFFHEARDIGLEQIKRNDPMNEIIAGLPTCTDFRGTYRFWPSITISRFHAVVYRFWKMREFLGLVDSFCFVFAGISESSPHLAPTTSQGSALPL